MFGNKKLKEELSSLNYRVQELEFTIKNPPKYKVGDIIKDGKQKGEVVTSVRIKWYYSYMGYSLIKVFPDYWVYDSININK